MSNEQKLPLLLIPGLACTKALFSDQIRALEGEYEIIIGDHTGHDSFGAIAYSILRKAPERFALAGLSMGGRLAFEILRQAPERVERLALLDTSAGGDSIEMVEQRRIAIELAKAGKFDQVCRATVDIIIASSRQNDIELKNKIVAMAMDMGAESWILQVQALMGRASSVALLPYIKCPTVVIVGDEDRLTPLDLSVEMAENIPGARLEVIKDCGHMSTMERPDEVTALLREWLK